MKILVIGGTGAIGEHLVSLLADDSNNILDVVCRSEVSPKYSNVKYVQGNAFDKNFIENKLSSFYDAIVDFMIYDVSDFIWFCDFYLNHCKQYIYTSTSSVYTGADFAITPSKYINENTERLYDRDYQNLKDCSDVYYVIKSKLEDELFNRPNKNWTVIRPYVSYNKTKLPFAVDPMKVWLYRVLTEKPIVVPEAVLNCYTTLTYGEDVANCIYKLVGNDKAIGEIINIASSTYFKWKDLISVYNRILEKHNKHGLKIRVISDISIFEKKLRSYYLLYKDDRLLTRAFDSSKLENIIGEKIIWTDSLIKIGDILDNLLDNNLQIEPDPAVNGMMDSICHICSVNDFSGGGKIIYLRYRYDFINRCYMLLKKIVKRSKRNCKRQIVSTYFG